MLVTGDSGQWLLPQAYRLIPLSADQLYFIVSALDLIQLNESGFGTRSVRRKFHVFG